MPCGAWLADGRWADTPASRLAADSLLAGCLPADWLVSKVDLFHAVNESHLQLSRSTVEHILHIDDVEYILGI